MFYAKIFTIMHKLCAVQYHLNNYLRLEAEYEQEAIKLFNSSLNESFESFKLIFELEAFLFQVKSTLDMLVKILIPIIGEGKVRTFTYSKAGDDLIKGLNQLKKASSAKIEDIDKLILLITDDKDSWIKKVIEWRDELHHVKGLKDLIFIPKKGKDGAISADRPRYKGVNTIELMKQINTHLLEYCQDFICASLVLKTPGGLLLELEDETSVVKKFNDAIDAKFVKYRWSLKL